MHIRVMLHRGRELDVLSQVETLDGHQSLRGDYEAFVYGHPMLELSWRSLREGQDSSLFFRALAVSLKSLEEKVAAPPLLLAAFELKVCSLLGFRPSLRRCSLCGSLLQGSLPRFSAEVGGAVCPSCSPPAASRNVDPETLDLAEALLSLPLKELAALPAGPDEAAALLRLAAEYTESHLGMPLRSHEVVLRYLNEEGKRMRKDIDEDPRGCGPH